MIGITPACAGKSRLQGSNLQLPGDHPRVCGEKRPLKPPHWAALGSPPRVRGKAESYDLTELEKRITPACAGKSVLRSIPALRKRDHPRVCGEKQPQ